MSLTTQINNGFAAVGVDIKELRNRVGTLASLTTTDKDSVVDAINEVKSLVGAGSPTNLDDLLDVVIASVASGHILRYNASTSKWENVLGSTVFDPAGTAASAVAAAAASYQPTDADLTAIAALTTTSYGRAFLTLANTAGLMGLLSDGTESVKGILQLASTVEATTGSNTTKAVTPAGLKAGLDALIAAAPGTLDTLDEIAAALGDDPNFATTISTALGNRVRTDTAAQGLNPTQQLNARTNIDVYSKADIGDPATDFVATYDTNKS